IAMFAFFAFIAPVILQPSSISTVLYGASTIGIMAVGVSLLMNGGEFDLSTGVAVLSSGITASLLPCFFVNNVRVGAAAALAFSLRLGFINGVIVIKTRLPSFLVTLAMFLMLAGLNLALSRLIGGSVSTRPISDMDGFASAKIVFGSSLTIGGVSVRISVLYWILLVIIASWVLHRTKIGNWIYAAGGDEESARSVGVPVVRTKIGLFMTVG